MYVCIYEYIYTYIAICLYVCIYTYTYMYIHIHIHMCICIYIYMCVYIYTYIYTYIYICIYIYIYMCIYLYSCIERERKREKWEKNLEESDPELVFSYIVCVCARACVCMRVCVCVPVCLCVCGCSEESDQELVFCDLWKRLVPYEMGRCNWTHLWGVGLTRVWVTHNSFISIIDVCVCVCVCVCEWIGISEVLDRLECGFHTTLSCVSKMAWRTKSIGMCLTTRMQELHPYT